MFEIGASRLSLEGIDNILFGMITTAVGSYIGSCVGSRAGKGIANRGFAGLVQDLRELDD